ncbi:MAG TPA: hypothetical protein VFL90_07810 [Methylomirabilota bacterium]|nr:hypothetical protein [Methylomirabilota bacterium]
MSRLQRVWLPLAGAIVGLAVALRVYDLGALGPFYDEAANILTAIDPGTRRAIGPLAQGRPLLAVMFAPAGLAPAHALLIGRGLVAAAGVATTLSLGVFLTLAFSRAAALVGMLLWALSPFVLFHERLALQDPVVSMLLTLALTAVALSAAPDAARARRLAGAGVAGVLFGIAGLVKVSALVALPWLALAYVVVNRRRGAPLLDARLACLALAAALPFVALGSRLVRLGRWLQPAGMLAGSAAIGVLDRARLFLYWYAGYEGLALLGLLALALGWCVWRRERWPLVLAAGWLTTLAVGAAVYGRPYARYAHPDHLPLVLFVASALALAWAAPAPRPATAATAVVLAAALGSWLVSDWQIVRAPGAAPVPQDEIRQYVDGTWSGVGLPEVKRLVAAGADGRPAVVVTHSYWTPASVGMVFAALGDPRVRVLPHTLNDVEALLHLDAVLGAARTASPAPAVFLLFEPPMYAPLDLLAGVADVSRVAEVDRGFGNRYVLLRYRGVDAAAALARLPVQQRTGDGWIGPRFAMRLPGTREFHSLRVTAETLPEFAARRPRVTFAVDDRALPALDLGAQPPRFTVDVPLPADGGVHTLRIEAARWFTAAEFGRPDDGRIVVMRLVSIEARR